MKIFLNILIFISLIFSGSDAHSNAGAQADKTPKFLTTCKTDNTVFKPFSITGNIVRCVEKVVNEASDTLIDNYIEGFATFVFYMTMIAILLFSIKVAFGVASARGIAFVFIMKVALVLAFTSPGISDTLKTYRDTFLEAPKYFSAKILEAMEFDGTTSEETVNNDVFDILDDYVLKLVGVKKPTTQANNDDSPNYQEEIFIGIAALVAGLFFTGPIGVTIATIALGFVFAIVFALAQAILFYATIVIALNFLIAISPLAMTAILFEPTKRITGTWVISFIGYAVQPIIFVAFMGLMLKCLDTVVLVFEPEYQKVQLKLENVNGEKRTEATLFECGTFKESGAARAEKKSSQDNMMDDYIMRSLTGFSFGGYQRGSKSYASATDTENDPSVTGCRFKAPVINIDYSDPAKDPQAAQKTVRLTENDLTNLKAAKFAVILMMMLMMGFMKELPAMINDITAQSVVSPISASISQGGGVVEAPIRALQSIGSTGASAIRTMVGR